MFFKGSDYPKPFNATEISQTSTSIKMPCKVKRLTSGSYGKFPSANAPNIQVMEYS